MKGTTVALIFVLALTGCTTVRTVHFDPSKTRFTLTRLDGRQIEASGVQASPDSLWWLDADTGRRQALARWQIKKITYTAPNVQWSIDPRSFDPTPSVASFVGINRLAQRKKARVTLADGRRVVAANLQVTRDSSSWRDPTTGRWQSAATAEIREIKFKDSSEGALMGLFIGALGGAAVGTQLYNPECFPEGFCIFISAGISGLVGGLAGAAVGVLSTKEDIYRFTSASTPPEAVVKERRREE